MLGVLLKDIIQAIIIALVFVYTSPGAEKLSGNASLLALFQRLLGDTGVFLISTLNFSLPCLLAGLTKNIFRRIEQLARK